MSCPNIAERIRTRKTVVGYWIVLDDPIATERIARLGYDYVAFDAQHGLLGYEGIRNGALAVDAGACSAPWVRVEQNDPFAIGRVLDAGATGVIVPLIDDAEDARRAVSATRYPPKGCRSYGPMRSQLRIGPTPAEADDAVACLAMIETPRGLQNVDEICAVDGIDGVYVGPSDLRLAVGGCSPQDDSVEEAFSTAVAKVAGAAKTAGVAAGIHTRNGEEASRRLGQDFTFVSIACDLVHLEQIAAHHLNNTRRDK